MEKREDDFDPLSCGTFGDPDCFIKSGCMRRGSLSSCMDSTPFLHFPFFFYSSILSEKRFLNSKWTCPTIFSLFLSANHYFPVFIVFISKVFSPINSIVWLRTGIPLGESLVCEWPWITIMEGEILILDGSIGNSTLLSSYLLSHCGFIRFC